MSYSTIGEKVTASKLIDSSIWLAYLIDNKHLEIINSDEAIFISSLSLFEIKKKLLKDKIKKEEIEEKIEFIKNNTIIINIDEKIAEAAAEISVNKSIPSIDSLIYATAKANKVVLLTRDNDFRKLANVEILN